MRQLLAGGLLFAAGGCATARPLDPYFPLHVGNEWHYRLTVGTAGLAVSSVDFVIHSQRQGSHAVEYLLDERGDAYYQRDDDSVSLSISPGIWTVFLQSPLVLGHRFDAARSLGLKLHEAGKPIEPDDPKVRPVPSAGYKVVTGLDRRVDVPAGAFEGCLEVTHIAGPIIGVKYYAPGVGMVYADTWMDHDGRRGRVAVQELLSYKVNP